MMNEERFAISDIFEPTSYSSSSTSPSSDSTSISTCSTSSCNSPSQIVKRRTSFSLESPSTRAAKRKCDLIKDVQKYTKMLDEASNNSIVNHLRKENASTRPVSRARVTRKHGEVVTEEDVITRGEEEEEMKAQKKRDIEARKLERAKKKDEKAQMKTERAQNKADKAHIKVKKNKILKPKFKRTLEESDCNICQFLFKDEDGVKKAKWIPCEKCDNWICPNCQPVGFHASDDYLCEECQND